MPGRLHFRAGAGRETLEERRAPASGQVRHDLVRRASHARGPFLQSGRRASRFTSRQP